MAGVSYEWHSLHWESAGVAPDLTDWSSDNTFPLDPDQGLARIIYRASVGYNIFATTDATGASPLVPWFYLRITVGIPDGVMDTLIETETYGPWTLGWAVQGLEGGAIYWVGAVPHLHHVDQEVRRAPGGETAHALGIRVEENVDWLSTGNFEAHELRATSRYSSSLQYLTYTPLP